MKQESYSKRIALITGASGALGESVLQVFLDAGFHVAGVSRKIENRSTHNPRFFGLNADLMDSVSTASAVQRIIDRFRRIDILVHLVGGFEGGKPLIETDDAAFDRMLDLNLRSAFRIIRLVMPHMRHAGFGRILAVGSRIAIEPQALVGAYGASKAALISLVRTLALENKDAGITANIVLPATIDTAANRSAMPAADRTRWVSPVQVAKLLLCLASDGAAQITGAQVPIYGSDA
jgi:NAD(P)-dependent dehydrogenase (short-subunit alcohol dehydrogenase family)